MKFLFYLSVFVVIVAVFRLLFLMTKRGDLFLQGNIVGTLLLIVIGLFGVFYFKKKV